MHHKLTLRTITMLTLPPLLWAGNAIVGRMLSASVPPITLNLLRWLLAMCIVLPFAWQVLRPSSLLWAHWRRYAVLGLLGIGLYNTFQYLALQTSTPLNVTLVGSSMPLWMLATGALFFGAPVSRRQVAGALLSMMGVLWVLSRGTLEQLLALKLVPGDLFMLLATISWSVYNWLLVRTTGPMPLRGQPTQFLMAQLFFGVLWSGLLAAGEWSTGRTHIEWSGFVVIALLFIAVGPALLAYRLWGAGIEQAGPANASFFANLTPLFAAILSVLFLGELPQPYHGVAFILIVSGIFVSSRR